MPEVDIVFFKSESGKSPPLTWLNKLDRKVRARGYQRIIKKLHVDGHELGMPHAKPLGGGIHELRWEYDGTHYRMLYFFYKDIAVVLTNGVVNQSSKTPGTKTAKKRMLMFIADPVKHSFDFNLTS